MATGWQIGRARGWPQLSKTRVVQILRVLGAATFAVLPPLALILVHSHRPAFTVAHLGPLLSLSAAAALALGLMIHRRTSARQLAAWRTVGTAILVLAGVLLLVLVAAAWPDPELLLVLGLMNCAILAVLGIVAELPLLYVPSVACAALSVVIGWHLVGGHFVDRDQLSLKIVQAPLRGQTSIALGLLGAVVGGMGGRLMARKKAEDALMLLASGGGLAVLSLAIALFSGFVAVPDWPQDRDLAAAILLVYAAALVAAAPLSRRQEVVACGSLLLWLAFVQALVFNATIRGWLAEMHWLPDTAGPHGDPCSWRADGDRLAGIARGTPRGRTLGHLLSEPLAIGAAISLAAATPFIAWVQHDQFSAAAALALWAALGWGALALAQSWPWALSAVQAMLALAPALLIAGVWKTHLGDANWFLNERHLFSQLIAAAVATMLWSPSRRLTSDRKAASRLLIAPWPASRSSIAGHAAMALPLVTILLVLPDIGWELNFEPYMRSPSLAAAGELPSALQYGWIALAVVLAALAVSLCERVSVAATSGVGIATFAAVSLAAGHFQPAAAAASASRWAAAVYAVLWGALYISRDPLRAACKQITWLRWDRFPRSASIWFCAQPLLLGGRAILILTIIAVSQHANGITLKGPAADSIFTALGPTVSYAGPLIALVVVLLGYAIRERQAAFALGGAAVWQLAVNLAWLLHVSTNQPADLQSIEWLQWNSIAAGAFACIWLGLSPWITQQVAGTLRVPLRDGTRSVPTTEQQVADGLWFIPLGLAGISAAALVGWAALAIFESPAAPAAVLMPLGSWLSYVAVGLVIAAAVGWAHGRLEFDGLGDAATWLAVGIASLVAATANRLDSGGQWLAYHLLGAGWLAIGRGGLRTRLLGGSRKIRVLRGSPRISIGGGHWRPASSFWRFAATMPTWQPWWSLGGRRLPRSPIAAALGLARRSQPYAFASTVLAGLSVILFWNSPATAAVDMSGLWQRRGRLRRCHRMSGLRAHPPRVPAG